MICVSDISFILFHYNKWHANNQIGQNQTILNKLKPSTLNYKQIKNDFYKEKNSNSSILQNFIRNYWFFCNKQKKMRIILTVSIELFSYTRTVYVCIDISIVFIHRFKCWIDMYIQSHYKMLYNISCFDLIVTEMSLSILLCAW